MKCEFIKNLVKLFELHMISYDKTTQLEQFVLHTGQLGQFILTCKAEIEV